MERERRDVNRERDERRIGRMKRLAVSLSYQDETGTS